MKHSPKLCSYLSEASLIASCTKRRTFYEKAQNPHFSRSQKANEKKKKIYHGFTLFKGIIIRCAVASDYGYSMK
jgi:hypothetical protein